MNYTSTRSDKKVRETYALLNGLAADGGLYVPASFPRRSITYKDIAGKSYQEIAAIVLSKFFTDFTENSKVLKSGFLILERVL